MISGNLLWPDLWICGTYMSRIRFVPVCSCQCNWETGLKLILNSLSILLAHQDRNKNFTAYRSELYLKMVLLMNRSYILYMALCSSPPPKKMKFLETVKWNWKTWGSLWQRERAAWGSSLCPGQMACSTFLSVVSLCGGVGFFFSFFVILVLFCFVLVVFGLVILLAFEKLPL